MTLTSEEEATKPPMTKRFERQQKQDESKRFERQQQDDSCSLLQCAELVLPWLTPPELAAVSLSCKSLHRISAAVTARRVADSAGALETQPVPFRNPREKTPLYSHFLYTTSQTLSSSSKRQSWGSALAPRGRFETADLGVGDSIKGCRCSGICSGGDGCRCFGLGGEVMSECGPSCGCGSECGNRVTQRGVSAKVKIVWDVKKGWCLCADELLPQGMFVCEYAGEVLTTEETRRRQQEYDELTSRHRFSTALMVVREHLPSGKACLRVNIDATRIGNVAKFINHSCDGGNLTSVLVRCSGLLLPRLCFFASRDIEKNEELGFSYGGVRLKNNGSRCYCGASSCIGWLPSEQT